MCICCNCVVLGVTKTPLMACKGSVRRYKYYCAGALSARRHVYITYEPQETTARTRQSMLQCAEPNLAKIMVVFCQ